MEFRNGRRMPLATWLGINLLAATLGLFTTLRLVLWIWDFLDGVYAIPTAGISVFPFELRLFFIVGFSVAGMFTGVVTGLMQWLMIRRMHVVSWRWILLSTISWLVGLPLSYEIFAILYDLFMFTGSFHYTSEYMPAVLFFIYFIGGIIASIGEWLILKIIAFYFLYQV